MPPENLIGKRIGKLVVVGVHPQRQCGHRVLVCKCDCGRDYLCPSTRFSRGKAQQCPECSVAARTIHGHARNQTVKSKTWSSWASMKQRCSNSNSNRFERYGGRGITYCERWEKFANFLEDMGLRPTGTTLDRIDNNRGYEPGNCRWATPKQQSENCERTKWVHVDGKRINLLDASKLLGKSWTSLFYALSQNGLIIISGHVLVPEWTLMKQKRAYGIDASTTR